MKNRSTYRHLLESLSRNFPPAKNSTLAFESIIMAMVKGEEGCFIASIDKARVIHVQ